MGDIAVEMENLRADVKALEARREIERNVSDYWYQRCQDAEKRAATLAVQLYDEIDNRRKSKTS